MLLWTLPYSTELLFGNDIMKRVLKWIGLTFVAFVVLLILIAILTPSDQSDDCNQVNDQKTSVPEIVFNQTNWHLAIAEARGEGKAYKGSPVKFAGKVFNVIGRSTDQTQVQLYADSDESEQNTLVVIPWELKVEDNQYLVVEGTLSSYYESMNLFGGKVRVPVVNAVNVEVTDRIGAYPPDVVIELNGTQIQHGLAITVERVELTPNETRVFINARNESTTKASLYAFSDDPIIVQGDRQVKLKNIFGENLPEHDDTLVPGTTTQGVLFFDPLSPTDVTAQLIWSRPRTDDYRLDFEDWVWNFSW